MNSEWRTLTKLSEIWAALETGESVEGNRIRRADRVWFPLSGDVGGGISFQNGEHREVIRPSLWEIRARPAVYPGKLLREQCGGSWDAAAERLECSKKAADELATRLRNVLEAARAVVDAAPSCGTPISWVSTAQLVSLGSAVQTLKDVDRKQNLWCSL